MTCRAQFSSRFPPGRRDGGITSPDDTPRGAPLAYTAKCASVAHRVTIPVSGKDFARGQRANFWDARQRGLRVSHAGGVWPVAVVIGLSTRRISPTRSATISRRVAAKLSDGRTRRDNAAAVSAVRFRGPQRRPARHDRPQQGDVLPQGEDKKRPDAIGGNLGFTTPSCRNPRNPIGEDTPASGAASSAIAPRAIAVRNRIRSSRDATPRPDGKATGSAPILPNLQLPFPICHLAA